MTSFKEVLAKALQNPEVRAEWDRTQLADDVSNWLLRYRLEHDLTQTELAQLLGWTQPIVARLEGGEREPSIATLHRLVARLGTTATISIRPEGVELHFTKPRGGRVQHHRYERAQDAVEGAASDSRATPRPRRGPVPRRASRVKQPSLVR